MRRHLSAYIPVLTVVLMAGTAVLANPVPPKVAGQAAVLIDSVSGKVIFEKACHARMEPASTTKMMTAILAIEHAKLADKFQASEYACKTPYGNLHLKPGEVLDLENLLTGTMLRSANDGATCMAEHVAGTEAKFCDMMNAKAKALGAKDTHFANPHGLHNPKHYSTAYDLALIARYAVKLPEFNEVVRTKTARIERSINKQDVFVKNTARFLWKYEGADGIKTGYTREAGRCFVGSATRNGWRLIAVVLKSPDAGQDTAALLDYGFKNFTSVCYAKTTDAAASLPVGGGVIKTVDLMPSRDLAFVLKKPAQVESNVEIETRRAIAPVTKGQKLGTLTAFLNGKKVGAVDLIAARSIERTLLATIWVWIRNILLVMLLLIVGLFIYGTQAAKAARRRRRGVPKRR